MTPADRPAGAFRRGWLGTALGIVVSGGLLWWAMRGVDLRSAVAATRSASLPWLLAGVSLATATFVIRVPRWRYLLRVEGGAPLGAGPAWHGIAIGFMANNLIPRSGEFLRAWVASRLAPVSFTSALSSVAVERIFDGLTLTMMLAVALLSPAIPPDARVGEMLVRDLAVRGGIACLILLAGALAVVAMPGRAERLTRWLVPWPGIADRLVGLLGGVVHGLGAMRSPARLGAVAVWSVILWSAGAASFWLVGRAFGIDLGVGGALLLQGVLAFGVAVPSTPGYVGVFEALIVAVLVIFGVERDLAFACAVTYHVTTFIPIGLLGAWSLSRTPVSLRDLRSRPA